MREVYFGNLSPGQVDEEVMRELLEPAMHELPEFGQEHGPAITKAGCKGFRSPLRQSIKRSYKLHCI